MLQKVAAEYSGEGYQVVVQPGDDVLPDFLKGRHPDLIATSSNNGNYVVEVKDRANPRRDGEKWSELAALIEPHSGWHFRLIVVGRDETYRVDYASAEPAWIERQLATATRLLREDELNGALLLAWSAFEAAARRSLLGDAEIPSMRSDHTGLVSSLIYTGVLGQEAAPTLRPIVKARNAIAHGVPAPITAEQVKSLIDAAAEVLRDEEATKH